MIIINYHQTGWWQKNHYVISSENIVEQSYINSMSPHFNLDLENSSPIFHVTLAPDVYHCAKFGYKRLSGSQDTVQANPNTVIPPTPHPHFAMESIINIPPSPITVGEPETAEKWDWRGWAVVLLWLLQSFVWVRGPDESKSGYDCMANGPVLMALPAMGQPGTALPAMGQPGIALPAMGQPGTVLPAMGQPGTALPAMGQPGTALPAMGQPGTALPAIGQPGVALPAMGQPGIALPAMGQPGTALPAMAQPGIALPAMGQPGTALSAMGQPGVALVQS